MDTVKEKVTKFFNQSKVQVYKKGEILIRADENPIGIFYLKEGLVKEYAISKKGEEIVVNIFKPDSFFPMSWAITNTQNIYYYEATSEIKICRASKENVLSFIKQNPDVLYDLLSRVYLGADGMITRMVYLMSESAYDRLIVELLIHIRRLGTREDKSYKVELIERDLASRSGMTRETVSRELKKLSNKGLVKLSRNILTVDNIDLLEKELSSI